LSLAILVGHFKEVSGLLITMSKSFNKYLFSGTFRTKTKHAVKR